MAVEVSVTEFRVLYPMFTTYSDEVVQLWLDYASEFVGTSRQCLKRDSAIKMGIYALTAHLLYMLGLGSQGLAGPVSNATEGSVSAGIAVPQINNKSWYLESPYGRNFWRIMAPCRLGGLQYTPHPYHPWG